MSTALCLITAFDNNPMLNSQFLDRGPVFSIFQKSNTEAVQASLNSSLRVWQSLLGSVAGCWLPARIMNQIAQAARIWCAHPPVSALHSYSTFHRSLSICPRGCCWRRWVRGPGGESSASPNLTLAPTTQCPVLVTLVCSRF